MRITGFLTQPSRGFYIVLKGKKELAKHFFPPGEEEKTLVQFYIWALVHSIIAGLLAYSPPPVGAEPPQLTQTPFEQIKTLVGTWHGTREAYDGEETITAEYTLTAKDSAVVERLFPDTPKEMVSVYTQDGHDLVMTHYCMLGNQPRMKTHGQPPSNSITLTYVDGTGMRSIQDMHMHELTITFLGKNRMTHQWTLFDKGQKKVTHTFLFIRE